MRPRTRCPVCSREAKRKISPFCSVCCKVRFRRRVNGLTFIVRKSRV